MKKKRNTADRGTPQTYKALKKLRGDWGNLSPVTKVVPNKKKDDACRRKEREIREEGE